MRLGVVLPLLLMCVLLGGVMIFLPLFWFADPRTPGCSKSDPSLSPPPEIACYASAMRLLCVSSLSLCDLGLWVSLFGSRIAEGTPSESIMNG